MPIINTQTLAKLVFVAGLSIATRISYAQTNDTIPESQLGEIIVTAQKESENLQKVPFSVSALDARKVEEMNLWQTKDLRGYIPNLYSSNPGDNRNVMSIRGITTTSYEPAVATYVDGVNQFGLDTYFFLLNDVERIEVLRGPQGTLYGRNAMGGVMNIITKPKSDKLSGFVRTDVGNYGFSRIAAGVKTMVLPQKVYVGVSILSDKLDGYYTNLFNDSNFDKQRNMLIAGNVNYLFAKNWEAILNFKSNSGRNNGPFSLAPNADSALENPFEVNQNAITEMVDDSQNISLVIKNEGPNLNFSSQTAYQNNYRYYKTPIDGDFSPIDGVSIVNNYGRDWNTVSVWTQEFRLASANTGQKLNWQVGFFGFNSEAPTKQGIYFGDDAALVGSPISNFTTINTNVATGYGFAFFGQASYSLTDRLKLTGGLRSDYEKKKLTVSQEMDFGQGDPMVTQPDTTSKVSYNAISPKVALAYQLANTNEVYGSYSRGFRPGGLSEIGSDPSNPPLFAYDPEFSNNFEIGSKNYFFNRRMRVNVSAFITTISDVQVPGLILPDAIVVTTNAGDLTSTGVEWEVSALPSKDLSIDWSFGYTHATFDKLMLPGESGEVDYSGNRQIFTPDVTSMVAVQWTPQFFYSSQLSWLVRAEWLYFGEQFFNLENTIRQDAYQIANAKFGVMTDTMELSLWAKNIFDTTYIDYAYNFGPAHLGNPATFGVTAMYKF
ncbi:iron complex outermembrane receptor protein [Algoriphagus sp. 4150]|uniref:TonB-dependent receptor n=1 Tax=Algoriphagus sp. 4150 TaxID=2817756 RepID=UPI00285B24A8|nr:TonB-dependent receptor [Algoriphagus sp. 4150]MDR7132765.1 iron complex outermembrane receptor protein [Algoriphagus sp. 4150]